MDLKAKLHLSAEASTVTYGTCLADKLNSDTNTRYQRQSDKTSFQINSMSAATPDSTLNASPAANGTSEVWMTAFKVSSMPCSLACSNIKSLNNKWPMN